MSWPPPLQEGWYLMSLEELQQELRRFRQPGSVPPTGAPSLTVEEARAYRDAGNLPDDRGRTLRLVLHVGEREPGALERRRLAFEPDFHDEPTWRRPGSVPVNVVPLAAPRAGSHEPRAWFEEPGVAALEAEWQATGAVGGLRIPAELRGFVLKTVLALRAARKDVTTETVSASIARWVPAADAARIRAALSAANAPRAAARGRNVGVVTTEVLRMSTIEESVEVEVPVRTAYNQWTQFEEFPRFMDGVERIDQLDDQRLHWVAEVGGRRREWDAKITEQTPDQRIAWYAIGETRHAGVVTFHRLDERRTRVMLQMEFEPTDWAEKAGDALGVVRRRVKGDLGRFKQFIEGRGQETGEWRGTIEQDSV